MPSFYARYESTDGKPLLGGYSRGTSSRFGSRELAEHRLEAAISINGGPSRCRGEVAESRQYPEIFTHCESADMPQCIGARCPECGKVLTVADAKATMETMQ